MGEINLFAEAFPSQEWDTPEVKLPGSNSFRLGLLGFAALASASCDGTVSRQVPAIVLATEGEVKAGKSGTPRTLALNDAVAPGETLRTGADASAFLLILPGALLHLSPTSVLHLEKIVLSKNGNATDEAMARTIHLRLLAGSADVVVEFEADPDRCHFATPQGRVVPLTPGAVARLLVTSHETRLVVARGRFAFFENAETPPSVVAAGFFQSWPGGGDAIAAETDAESQDQIDKLLQMEWKLLRLERARRFSPRPWRDL